MARAALCLRVDSPYPGESMSSFLSRTAQFYLMSTPALLKELLQGQSWSSLDRRDVDLAPSPLLEQRLSETVPDWHSPLEGHENFMRWTLAQRQRLAYCPRCFLEDLAEGKTPYFRNDWIPVLVTSCWKHRTPLFDWEIIRSGGWRQLPRSWVYQLNDMAADIPEFMRRHLDLLSQLGTPEESSIDLGVRIPLSEMLSFVYRLQALVEKPSATPMPPYEPFRTDLGALRHHARELVLFSARYQHRDREPPVAAGICPDEISRDWISPIPWNAARRRWELTDVGLRQTGCVSWRRCYLLFTTWTLLGMERYRALLPAAATVPLPSWRDWWQGWAHPRLGPEQQRSLGWFAESLLRDA